MKKVFAMKRKNSFVCIMLMVLFSSLFLSTNIKAAGQLGPVKISGGQRDFKWPVPGNNNISGCFNDEGRDHLALDIFCLEPVDVVASYAGSVIETVTNGNNDGGYGNGIMIESDNRALQVELLRVHGVLKK